MNQNESTEKAESFRKDPGRDPLRFLVFSASLRMDSLNTHDEASDTTEADSIAFAGYIKNLSQEKIASFE